MKLSIKDLLTFKPKVSLEQLQLDPYYLTSYQRNKVDCHRLIKQGFCPFYQDNIARSIEFPFQGFENSFDLEVLPCEEAEAFTKYFTSDFPSDQLWGRPIVIHYIGRVGFYSVIVYSDRKTRLRLEAADQNPKPEIFYKYNIGDREVEADSQYLVARIAYEQRLARRETKELQQEVQHLETVIAYKEEELKRIVTEIANSEQKKEDLDPGHVDEVTLTAQGDTIQSYSGISSSDLFGRTDDEEEDRSSDDSQYCQVIAVKRQKTDPNEKPWNI